jgi:hypothetical protein
MKELNLLGNKLEQVETALSGILERISKMESMLEEFDKGQILFVDKDMSLLSQRPQDYRFVSERMKKIKERARAEA